MRILGTPDLDVINLYRPPICQDETDERTDNFNPDLLPHGGNVIDTGDISAHHPLWDSDCDQADEVGEAWRRGWIDAAGPSSTMVPQPSPATAPEA